MPEKQKARGWKEIQTIIAAVSMVILMALCNLMANFERREKGELDSLSSLLRTPTPPAKTIIDEPKIVVSTTQVITSTGSS